MERVNCNICSSEAKFLFKSFVLNKYEVDYYKCPICEFIQTESPYWLDEAYKNAITDLDIGLVSRNATYSIAVEKIILDNFKHGEKFLDYAGGYGLFVRLMRDKGFNFYREEKYCENIFAKNYDLVDLIGDDKFEIITTFEVFEHLVNPLEEIKNIFKYSDSLIFSTELQPPHEIKDINDWWYFVPETGQHISFYSLNTLKYIALKFKCYFYSNGSNLHLFTNKKFVNNPLSNEQFSDDNKKIDITNLIQSDYDFAKNVIRMTDEIKKEIPGDVNNLSELNDKMENQSEILVRKLSLSYAELERIKSRLEKIKSQLENTNSELNSTKSELASAKSQLETSNSDLDSTRYRLETAIIELGVISNSYGWRLILFLYKSVNFFFPTGSLRRRGAVIIWNFSRSILQLIINICQNLSNGFRHFRKYLAGSGKPKKRRRINTRSKKIAYIGHSYHNKTKSTAFLIDYLKEYFDVEVILDESWLGEKPFPDLSFIDNSYLCVIFFQNLPKLEVLESIKNENIVFFPMYDSVELDYEYWKHYQNLRIVNFSRTLNDIHLKLGFDSIYVQYFPEPKKIIPGNKDEVFFWQRLTQININTIKNLIGDNDIKIHIHKAIDPNHQFIQPSMDDENKYHITYSEWFETREDMRKLIEEKAIYISPRELEGIGMSFLEAMSMGKAVIAVDNPTMNEYIEHNKTGYLFNLSDPHKIDISNIEQVQVNTFRFICKGYLRWEEDKQLIIDFIKGKKIRRWE